MRVKKTDLPKFKTDAQEAEYWDTHSPLDGTVERKAEAVRAKRPKDAPITIRLDSVSRTRLEKLAAERGVGPSTFARLTLLSAIQDVSAKSDNEEGFLGGQRKRDIGEIQVKLQEAMRNALVGDWSAAVSLIRAVSVGVPGEYSAHLKGEIQMIWMCIQRVNVEPLVTRAENSLVEWEYEETASALADIAAICKTVQLPLDYSDLFVRILTVARSTSGAAAGWKGSVDAKLNRVVADLGIMNNTIEKTVSAKLQSQALPKPILGSICGN